MGIRVRKSYKKICACAHREGICGSGGTETFILNQRIQLNGQLNGPVVLDPREGILLLVEEVELWK
jgi:hypothetical protein